MLLLSTPGLSRIRTLGPFRRQDSFTAHVRLSHRSTTEAQLDRREVPRVISLGFNCGVTARLGGW